MSSNDLSFCVNVSRTSSVCRKIFFVRVPGILDQEPPSASFELNHVFQGAPIQAQEILDSKIQPTTGLSDQST